MKNNNYNYENEEKEFEKLKTLLRELPKIETPQNFEYNLLTRIHNKNFEIKSEKKRNLFYNIYAPSFALVATVMLVFFLFTDNGIDEEDPWNTQPEIRPEVQAMESENSSLDLVKKNSDFEQSNEITKNDQNIDQFTQGVQPPVSENMIASSKPKQNYPFDKSQSVDLDKMLESGEKSTPPSLNYQSQLAGTNPQPSKSPVESVFDGFWIRQREAEARKESLRTFQDSLKKAQDSVSNSK